MFIIPLFVGILYLQIIYEFLNVNHSKSIYYTAS